METDCIRNYYLYLCYITYLFIMFIIGSHWHIECDCCGQHSDRRTERLHSTEIDYFEGRRDHQAGSHAQQTERRNRIRAGDNASGKRLFEGSSRSARGQIGRVSEQRLAQKRYKQRENGGCDDKRRLRRNAFDVDFSRSPRELVRL